MTTPLAPVGLTYDGTDLQPSDLSMFFEIVQGLDDGFDVRGIDVTVPGADGQVPRPRRFHQTKILLRGHVMGAGAAAQANYRLLRQTVSTLFAPDRDPASLIATLEDGETVAIVSARPLSIIPVEQAASLWADLSVELLAVEQWTIALPIEVSPAPVAATAAVPAPTIP